jgi:hypothetical protein
VQPPKIKRGPYQKPPIRLVLAKLKDEPTSVSKVPAVVSVPRGHRKGQPSFEWTDKKFFVIVAEDEDGHHCAVRAQRPLVRNECSFCAGHPRLTPTALAALHLQVDKELKLRYEIFDTNDKSTADPIHSSGTAKTWQKKYFWVSAVTFVEDGKYEIRFSADCKKYHDIPPLRFHVTAASEGFKGVPDSESEEGPSEEALGSEEKRVSEEASEGSEGEAESDGHGSEAAHMDLVGFHPSQLRDMSRVEMQHLVVRLGVAAKGPNDQLRRELSTWYAAKHGDGGGVQLLKRSASPTAEALLDGFEPKRLQGLRREKLQNMTVLLGEPARVSNDQLRMAILKWHKGGKTLAPKATATEGSDEDEARPEKRSVEARPSAKRSPKGPSKGRAGSDAEQLDESLGLTVIPPRLQKVLLDGAQGATLVALPRPTPLTKVLARFCDRAATSGASGGGALPELVEQVYHIRGDFGRPGATHVCALADGGVVRGHAGDAAPVPARAAAVRRAEPF